MRTEISIFNYLLHRSIFSRLRYLEECKKIEIELTNEATKDIGKIPLSEKTLKEVEVVAAKPLIKREMDRMSYSLENDPDSKSSTLIEMIKKVPMLSVDNDDNLKLKGRTKFKILLDGKETDMSADDLKNMMKATPANTIKEIQVITDPGAKYESDGLERLINIVTQKTSKLAGYVVNLNAGGDSFGGCNSGISTQAKYGKIGISANLSRNYYKRPASRETSKRETYNDNKNTYLTSEGSDKLKGGANNYANIQLNYEIDSLNLLSIKGSLNKYNYKNASTSISTIQDSAFVDQYSYQTNSDNNYSNQYSHLDLNYQLTSAKNKDRTLTLSYQLNYGPRKSTSNSNMNNLLNYSGYSSQSFSNQKDLNHNFQIDFSTPLKKVHTIETGLKFIRRINKSLTNYAIQYPESIEKEDSTSVNNFRSQQDIFSAYLSYKYTSKKWSVRSGLRLENRYQKIEYPGKTDQDFNKTYLTLVPNIIVSYMPNQNTTFKAKYRMGMWRPSIWFLNPYNTSTDTLIVRTGNPNLDSEKSHLFGIGYSGTIKKVVLNLDMSYSFSNNSINDITELKNNVTYTTYDNIGKTEGFETWANISWNPNAKFQLSANGGINYLYYKIGGTTNQKSEGLTSNFSCDMSYTGPYKLRFGANTYYYSPWINVQGKGSGYYNYGFSVSRNFLKGDRLNVRLNTNQPFNSTSEFKEITETSSFRSENKSQYHQSYFGISASFRIGDMKVKIKEVKKGITTDDVKSGGNEK